MVDRPSPAGQTSSRTYAAYGGSQEVVRTRLRLQSCETEIWASLLGPYMHG